MLASELAPIIKATQTYVSMPEQEITRLLTDSRSFSDAEGCIFFAIPTKRNNGVYYIQELYKKGGRSFVISNETEEEEVDRIASMEGVNLYLVKDVVKSLQLIARNRREQFDIPVVGITGSNGKTIVKEWIVQLRVRQVQV